MPSELEQEHNDEPWRCAGINKHCFLAKANKELLNHIKKHHQLKHEGQAWMDEGQAWPKAVTYSQINSLGHILGLQMNGETERAQVGTCEVGMLSGHCGAVPPRVPRLFPLQSLSRVGRCPLCYFLSHKTIHPTGDCGSLGINSKVVPTVLCALFFSRQHFISKEKANFFLHKLQHSKAPANHGTAFLLFMLPT